MTRTSRLSAMVCMLMAYCCPIPIQAENPLQDSGQRSRFERTLLALQSDAEEELARFASTALLELAEVYLAEADLARQQARSSGQGEKLLGWSRAVDLFADQLLLVLGDIDRGAQVVLRFHHLESPSVSIAGRSIMLSHPRAGQQGVYERAVLERYCAVADCAALTATPGGEERIPPSKGTVFPQWAFSDQGPRCQYLGLAVAFSPGGNIARQRSLCKQLMAEIELLAAELAWQSRHGVVVDWSGLTIKPTPGLTQHLVGLNPIGDSLLISLPLLNNSPDLLHRLGAWLEQRFSDEPLPSVVLNAAEWGWE